MEWHVWGQSGGVSGVDFIDIARLGRAYDFAVEVVLLDHDCIDSLGVSEGQEAETARAATGAVAHDGAFENIAKLREVVAQGFYGVR